MDQLILAVHEYEAQQRWARGEQPMFSTGYDGLLTCGYGKLDWSGEWQFPLCPAEYYLAILQSGNSHDD